MPKSSDRNTRAACSGRIGIRVTPHGGRQFVPRVGPDARLLGVVQRGMQIGALARMRDGSYVQVNGDFVQPLNRSQVEAALRSAGMAVERVEPSAPLVASSPAPAVAPPDGDRQAAPPDSPARRRWLIPR